jgi:amino acid transporter
MSTQRTFSVLSLIMINLAALGGIRTWAPMAESGFTSVFFLLFGVLTFFIPVSLITAELATTWPQSGGVYAWIRQAFGHRLGVSCDLAFMGPKYALVSYYAFFFSQLDYFYF